MKKTICIITFRRFSQTPEGYCVIHFAIKNETSYKCKFKHYTHYYDNELLHNDHSHFVHSILISSYIFTNFLATYQLPSNVNFTMYIPDCKCDTSNSSPVLLLIFCSRPYISNTCKLVKL